MDEDTEDDVPQAVPLTGEERSDEGPSSPSKNVPVTLITGFLGAGKTTLVRYILTGQHGYRIAVIMNEFGESVESSYFHTPEGKVANLGEWVELSNGCLCCAVKSEFVQALEALLARRSNFDYILIETTGMANPGPVAAALWTDEQLEAGVQLDSVVTVVDAVNIGRQLRDPRPPGVANEAQVQVAYADIVLLNKADLADEEAVEQAVANIRAINSGAQLVHTQHCMVDLSLILNRQGYGLKAGFEVIEECEEDKEDKEVPGSITPPAEGRRLGRDRSGLHHSLRALSLDSHHSLGEASGHHDHDLHDDSIHAVSLRSDHPLDLDKVRSFVDRLLWDREAHPEEYIYRIKGVLHVSGSERKQVLQAVYELYNIAPTAEWGPAEARRSVLVVIGRGVRKEELQDGFRACEVAD